MVTTVKVEAQNFIHFLELQGNVQTKQNLVIYPEMGGILEHVYVKEGQRVTKGQLLAKLDDGGLGQQLAQLHKQHDQAMYGFDWDTILGSTAQPNKWQSNWSSFFSEQRIGWLLQLLLEKETELRFLLPLLFNGYSYEDLLPLFYDYISDLSPCLYDYFLDFTFSNPP